MSSSTQTVHPNTKLNAANFFRYYIIHPNDATLSSLDKAISTVASLTLGIVTVGLVHLACYLLFYNRAVTLLPPNHHLAPLANKICKVMKAALNLDSPAKLTDEELKNSILDSHKPTLTSLPTNLFAHIHSDSYAKESGLEGNRFSDSFAAAIAYLKDERVKIPKKEELLNNYQKMHTWCKKLESNAPCDKILEEVMTAITNLKEGESIELPGGWTAPEGGHAMIYSITCKGNGQYVTSILNTGDGVDSHYCEYHGGKLKGLCRLRLDQKEVDMTHLKEGIRLLLEIKRPEYLNAPIPKRRDYLYNTILPMMGLMPIPLDTAIDVDNPRTLQRSGTCSWKVQMAYLDEWINKHSTNKEEAATLYKAVKRHIRLVSLLDFYHLHKHDLNNHEVAVQIEKTLPRINRSLEKAKKRGEVPEAEVKQTVAITDALRSALDKSYKRSTSTLTFDACENPYTRKGNGKLTATTSSKGKERLEHKTIKPIDPKDLNSKSLAKAAIELNFALIEDRDKTIKNAADTFILKKRVDHFLTVLKDYSEQNQDCPNKLFENLNGLSFCQLDHSQLMILLYCVNKLTHKKREALGLTPLGTGGLAKDILSSISPFYKTPDVSNYCCSHTEESKNYMTYLVDNDSPGVLSKGIDAYGNPIKEDPFSKSGIDWIEKAAGLSPGSCENSYTLISLIDGQSANGGKLPTWARMLLNLSLKCCSKEPHSTSLYSFLNKDTDGKTTLTYPSSLYKWRPNKRDLYHYLIGSSEDNQFNGYLTEPQRGLDFESLFVNYDDFGKNLLIFLNKHIRSLDENIEKKKGERPVLLPQLVMFLLIPGMLEKLFNKEPHYIDLYASFFHKAITFYTHKGDLNTVATLAEASYYASQRMPEKHKKEKLTKFPDSHALLFDLYTKNPRNKALHKYLEIPLPYFPTPEQVAQYIAFQSTTGSSPVTFYNGNSLLIHNYIAKHNSNDLPNQFKIVVENSKKLGITLPEIPWEQAACKAYNNGTRIQWKENGKYRTLDYLYGSVILDNTLIGGNDKFYQAPKEIDNYSWKGAKFKESFTEYHAYRDYYDDKGNTLKLRYTAMENPSLQACFGEKWYDIDSKSELFTDKALLKGLLLEGDTLCINNDSGSIPTLLICNGTPLKEKLRVYLSINKRSIQSVEWVDHPEKLVVVPNGSFTDPIWGSPRMALEPEVKADKKIGILSYPKMDLTFDIIDEGEGKNSFHSREFPGYTLSKKATRHYNKPQQLYTLQNSKGEQIIIEPGTHSRKEIRLSPDGTAQAITLKENLQALDYYLRQGGFPDSEEKARHILQHCLPTRPMSEEEEQLMRSIIIGREEEDTLVSAEMVAIRLKLAYRWHTHFDTYPSAVNPFTPNPENPISQDELTKKNEKFEKKINKLLSRYTNSNGVNPPLTLFPSELKRLGASFETIQALVQKETRFYPTHYQSAEMKVPRPVFHPTNNYEEDISKWNKMSLKRWLELPTLEARDNVINCWKELYETIQGNDSELKKIITFRLKTAPYPTKPNDDQKEIAEKHQLNESLCSLLLCLIERKIEIPNNLSCYHVREIGNLLEEKLGFSLFQNEWTLNPKATLYSHSPRGDLKTTSPNDKIFFEEETSNKPLPRGIDPILPPSQPTLPDNLQNLVESNEINRSPQTFKFDSPSIQDPTIKHHLQRIDNDLEAYRSSSPATILKVKDKAELSTKLNELINSDLDKLQQEKKKLLELANKCPDNPEDILWRKVAERSGSFEKPTIDRLVGLYLHARNSEFLKMNPTLSKDDICDLVDAISSYIDLKTTIDRRQRVVAKLQDPEETDDAISEALQEARHYNNHEYPQNRLRAFQVFEFFSGKSLRKKQVDMLNAILDGKDAESQDGFVKQLIMGGGKSEVILPLLAALLADGCNLPILCVPRSLLESQREEMRRFCMNLFGRNVMPFEFDRSSDSSPIELQKLYDKFKMAINKREFVMATPETIEALQHLQTELLEKGENTIMIDLILQLFKKRGIAILDEAHAILNARRELNYTLGDKITLEPQYLLWVRQLYQTLATDSDLKKLIDLAAPSAPSDSKIHEKAIKERLAICMIEECHPSLSDENKQLLINYLTRDTSLKTTPPFLATLTKAEQSRLALYREEIGRLLATTLGKVALQEFAYGPSVFAIPAHNSQVQEGTEFGFPLEAVNYTYQLILSAPLPVNYMRKIGNTILNTIKEKLELDLTFNLETDEDMKTFKRLFPNCTIHDDIEQHLPQAIEALHRDPLLALEIAERYILPYLTYYPLKISSNSIRFVDMFGKVFGFTGTPFNDDSYPDKLEVGEKHLDKGTDGFTCDLLLGMKPTVSVIKEPKLESTAEPKEIAEKLVKNLAISPQSKVRAVIDTAAYFKGIPNILVAEEIKNALGSGIQGINYYDVDKKITSGEKDPNKVVTYYDDAHTIGAHFNQAPEAEAIVLIGENIKLSHLLQAVWRMRQIHRSQKISFALTEAVHKLIQEKQECQEVTIEEILRFAAANQADHVALDTYRATSLKFAAAIKNCFEKIYLKAISADTNKKLEIYAGFKPLDGVFTEANIFDPLLQFGAVNFLGNTVDILTGLRTAWIDKVKTLPNVDAETKEQIIAELKAVVIPLDVKMPLRSELPFTEVGSEVSNQSQKQTQQQAEKQTQLEMMIEQYANNKIPNATDNKEKWKWKKNALEQLDGYVDRQRQQTENFTKPIDTDILFTEEPPLKPATTFSSLFSLLDPNVEVYFTANCYAKSNVDTLEDTLIGNPCQRPVRHILVLDGSGQPDGKTKLIIVNEDNMKDLSPWLTEHKEKTHWIYHRWTDNTDMTSALEEANQKMAAPEIQKALLLIKLVDGQVNFDKQDQMMLEQMVEQLGTETFAKEAAQFIYQNPEVRAKIKTSTINRLLQKA